MLYILQYGDIMMGSKSRLFLRTESGIMHIELKCKGLHIAAVKIVTGCLL